MRAACPSRRLGRTADLHQVGSAICFFTPALGDINATARIYCCARRYGRRVWASPNLRPSRQVRRIGVLMGLNESNPELRGFVVTFAGELRRLGWIDGRSARIEQRWTNADIKRASAFATELVAS